MCKEQSTTEGKLEPSSQDGYFSSSCVILCKSLSSQFQGLQSVFSEDQERITWKFPINNNNKISYKRYCYRTVSYNPYNRSKKNAITDY